jgi:hypothetical protein
MFLMAQRVRFEHFLPVPLQSIQLLVQLVPVLLGQLVPVVLLGQLVPVLLGQLVPVVLRHWQLHCQI